MDYFYSGSSEASHLECCQLSVPLYQHILQLLHLPLQLHTTVSKQRHIKTHQSSYISSLTAPIVTYTYVYIHIHIQYV